MGIKLSSRLQLKFWQAWMVGLAALMALAGMVWASVPPKRLVRIYGAAEAAVVRQVRAHDVATALKSVGVVLGPQDRVQPTLSTALQDDLDIYVRRAVAVTVLADGGEQKLNTAAEHVGDVVSELKLAVGPNDRVEPGFAAPVTPGLTISVVRVRQELATEEQEIPFAVERKEDTRMVMGETREVQKGESGTKQITIRKIFENGLLKSAETLNEAIVKPAVPMVVAYGTLGVVSRGDTEYRYTKALDMIATAYSIGDGMTPGTITRMGLPARRGLVAVDPDVIPLGTKLYIEGYGPAMAADTGSAIIGNKIDLYLDTIPEVEAFGVQRRRVYILADQN